jgi:hypothetical protein
MPYEPTGAKKSVFITRCPINEGHECGKGRSQLKRCVSEDDARMTVYNHIKWSPYHNEDSARATEFMEKADVERYEEDEQTYVATDDESDASGVPPPADRQPRKKRRRNVQGQASSSQARDQAGDAINRMPLNLVPRILGATTVALLPPSADDDTKVTFRKSQLKLIHDCIVRAAHGARQAENIAERALAAFSSEAQNLERIADSLGSAITGNTT